MSKFGAQLGRAVILIVLGILAAGGVVGFVGFVLGKWVF